MPALSCGVYPAVFPFDVDVLLKRAKPLMTVMIYHDILEHIYSKNVSHRVQNIILDF